MITIITILIFIITVAVIFSGRILISDQKERWFIFLGSLMIVGAFVFPITTLLWNKAYNLEKVKALGAYGDFFGGTTVGLLSIAGASFLVSSILLQMKSNEIQKVEMTKTNEQLDLQRKEFEITNTTMIKQSFENTYFNMINLYNSILNDLKVEDSFGRATFKNIYMKFKDYVEVDGLLNYFNEEVFCERDFFYEFYIRKEKEKFIDDSLKGFQGKAIISKYNNYERFSEDVYNDISDEWAEYWSTSFGGYEDDGDFGPRDEMEEIFNNKERRLDYIASRMKNEMSHLYFGNHSLIQAKSKYFNNTFNIEIRKHVYKKFYESIQLKFEHYYKNIEVIISYIEKVHLEEKELYNKIFKAQLSQYELIMLYYFTKYLDDKEQLFYYLKENHFYDEIIGLDVWNAHDA